MKALRCGRCAKKKHVKMFFKSSSRSTGYSCYCKKCEYAYKDKPHRRLSAKLWHRRYRKERPEAERYQQRAQQLKQYGLTVEAFDRLSEKQGGKCLICRKVPYDIVLVVDHCHQYGAVRGLLCRKCNAALGLFHDSPKLLRRAARYVESYALVKT